MQEYKLNAAGIGAGVALNTEPGYPVYAGKGWLHSFRKMGVINPWDIPG